MCAVRVAEADPIEDDRRIGRWKDSVVRQIYGRLVLQIAHLRAFLIQCQVLASADRSRSPRTSRILARIDLCASAPTTIRRGGLGRRTAVMIADATSRGS